MIQELNASVKYQGEIMDTVEINIKSTTNYIFKDEKTKIPNIDVRNVVLI